MMVNMMNDDSFFQINDQLSNLMTITFADPYHEVQPDESANENDNVLITMY